MEILGSSHRCVGRKGVGVCEQSGTISWPRVLDPDHDGDQSIDITKRNNISGACSAHV
jgi:hypothetical protein